MSPAPSPATGLLGTAVMWRKTRCDLDRPRATSPVILTTFWAMHASMGSINQMFRPLMLVKETLIHFDPAIQQ